MLLNEFSYNNSYQAIIDMTPYEALYERKCTSPVHWYETSEVTVIAPEYFKNTTKVVKEILARMEMALSRQKKKKILCQ